MSTDPPIGTESTRMDWRPVWYGSLDSGVADKMSSSSDRGSNSRVLVKVESPVGKSKEKSSSPSASWKAKVDFFSPEIRGKEHFANFFHKDQS
ncbi:hypothetical protein AVEN_92861-1 [Araneus ventricosus]|uniref:Uncharacterized protein n=1 Tax=Araneus ventricosus TaxID=182803 RepID=A0A4Y2NSF6_ARAVE|nr:hypothetical protein AVEN_92861-1 [Araneus ventricosus]